MRDFQHVAALAVLLVSAPARSNADFEIPPVVTAASVLPPSLASGADFLVADPVTSDGLVRHYTLTSRFGSFEAYGSGALAARVREVQALAVLAGTSGAEVVAGSVGRGVASQLESVATAAQHPVRTVTGIPSGIAHLFRGYADQGREAVDGARRAGRDTTDGAARKPVPSSDAAKRYAARYLGVSRAERRWYQQLGVDPYTDNDALKRAIRQHARLEAATGLGVRLAGLPGIPGVGVLEKAEQAIYQEDPATLRARTRRVLAGYGLTPVEIERLSNSLLLSPTRQALLLEAGAALEGVDRRVELFRHALGVSDELEAQVYVESVALLVAAHRERPLSSIVEGLRLPSAVRAGGAVIVCGAFDAVYWTAEVAAGEAALRAALPAGAPRELLLAGTPSEAARAALTDLGWTLREPAGPAPSKRRSER